MTEQTYFEEFEIQHIKFSSGDEVVSIVSGREGKHLLLEYPMKVNHMINNDNEVYWFTQYMPFGLTDITYVNENNVIAYNLVNDEVKEKYIRACLRSKHETETNDEIDHEIDSDTELYEMASPSNKIH